MRNPPVVTRPIGNDGNEIKKEVIVQQRRRENEKRVVRVATAPLAKGTTAWKRLGKTSRRPKFA
jgi:uncharacterized protein YabE (DUF348 family)